MGVESSLKNYMNQDWVKESISKDNNPEKKRRTIESAFRRRVAKGKIVLIPGGGFEGSKESQEESKKRIGTADKPSEFAEALAKKLQKESGKKVTAKGLAGQKFGYFPTGKKKGGKAKASKYSKGGGVRKSKYSL